MKKRVQRRRGRTFRPRQDAIIAARKAVGLKQFELAEKLGIKRAHVAALENGLKPIGPDLMMRWADALNVPFSTWNLEGSPIKGVVERLTADKNCQAA
jgi:transcriptional regulator with XRE-family HTH domain